MGVSGTERSESPYVGLDFFTESDADVFFGRDREQRIIIANLRASRLTLLYANSGVGKSSLIRAGVVSRLHELAARSPDEHGAIRYLPVVFSSWRDDPVDDLISEIERSLRPFVQTASPLRLPRTSLEDAIGEATAAATIETEAEVVDATLLVILDQFEEYFLYYSSRESQPGRMAESIASCIHRPDVRANFLIAVREDAYAGLGDLFKGRIENIYGNFLHLDYLDREGAKQAIEKPIERFNDKHPELPAATIEPELVERVLDGVRAGEVLLEESGQGTVPKRNGDGDPGRGIETAYLQLVMSRLWEHERGNGRQLGVETLTELGGAQEIVRRHLDVMLKALSPEERDTAVAVFHHLVTPSGTKIVHTLSDLASYSDRTQEQVDQLVQKLTAERVLRLVPAPAGTNAEPRVEIFHDVLAPAILAWRTRENASRLEAQRGAAENRARRDRRRAVISLILAVAALVLAVIAVLALRSAQHQRTRANHAQSTAESRQLAAQALTDYQNGPLGRGLLLGMEAYRSAPTAEARGALVGGLVKTEGMIAYLIQQAGSVTALAFDPHGSMFASASSDQSIVLWNAKTDRPAHTLSGHTMRVNSVAFSPTGTILASAGDDQRIILWDVASGRHLRTLTSNAGAVESVAFDPGGKLLASANFDGSATVWDVATGQPVRSFGPTPNSLYTVAFDPTGSELATGDAGGSVSLWDVRTGRRKRVLTRQPDVINALAFSPDGATIAVAGANGALVLLKAASGHVLGEENLNKQALEAVAFSPDGTRIITGGDDGAVRLWSAGGTLLRTYQGHTDHVNAVAFSPDGKVIGSGSDDQAVILWDATLGVSRTLQTGGEPLDGVAFAPGGEILAAAGAGGGSVRLWTLKNGRERTLPSPGGPIQAVAFSPDGRTVAGAGTDGNVMIWDVTTGQPIANLAGNSGPLWTVAFSPDGRLLAAGGYGQVIVWDAVSRKRLRVLPGHAGPVKGIAFSPDGHTLASAGADSTVLLQNAYTGRLLHTLTGHTAPVNSVAFSPNGRTLVSGSDDRTVIAWDAATGRKLGEPLRGHQDIVYSVAFSPDGQTVASASSDHTVIVWNLATRLGQPLDGHTDVVNGVAFSPDGETLASGSLDGTVVLYPSIPTAQGPQAINDRLCGVVRRNLTAPEWLEFLPGRHYEKTCPAYGR